MPDPPSPRGVVDGAFPTDAPAAERLRFLLHYAVLAPSVLNSQPWRFVVEDDAVRLLADRARQLPALDPDGRLLTLSCGAALLHLRVAVRHFGFAYTLALLPDEADPDLLARLELGAPARADARAEAFFHAIRDRRTERHPFAPVPVPEAVLEMLVEEAAEEGAHLAVVTDAERRAALAALVAEGVRRQGADRAVAEDVKAWLRPPGDPRPDGIPDDAQGEWDRRASVWVPVGQHALRAEALVREAPALAVLATPRDDPRAWLEGGMALGRVLLAATAEGVLASYHNAPVEVPALRPEVARLVGDGHPQLVLRLGYPVEREGTPRRAVRDVAA